LVDPEPEPVAETEAEPEAEVEAEQPRRRWFGRAPAVPEAPPEQPELLPDEPVAPEAAADPWEQGVDGHADPTDEPEAEPEPEAELAGRAQRFRRRRR